MASPVKNVPFTVTVGKDESELTLTVHPHDSQYLLHLTCHPASSPNPPKLGTMVCAYPTQQEHSTYSSPSSVLLRDNALPSSVETSALSMATKLCNATSCPVLLMTDVPLFSQEQTQSLLQAFAEIHALQTKA